MNNAWQGDVITFDPSIFLPEKPAVIALLSSLAELDRDGITLDASNAGVILDGSQMNEGWEAGFTITSEGNIIMGFEIANFSGPGILLSNTANNNQIGGDRALGNGPIGQGNLIRNTSDGIALSGSDNTIIGNLIGSNAAGIEKWGNRGPGIFLEENASHNVIGPDNIIAYNGIDGGGGIEFRSSFAKANHITRNNIHSNSTGAVVYNLHNMDTSIIPQPPNVMEFDLQMGSASGIACPNCTVELFSSDNKGDFFEGSVRTDADGHFTFQKNSPFQGERIKAISFAEGENNSDYSVPTTGSTRKLVFQMSNSSPRSLLSDIKFDDLAFNRIGTMQYIGCENEQEAADYAAKAMKMGFKWARVNVEFYDWPDILQTGEYSDFTVKPCQDKAIDILAQNGIEMFYTITYWDPEIKVNNGYSRFRTQEEIDHYLEYVKFIVGHFKGKIQYYSLMNEPNLSDGQRAVRVEDYINMARQAIPLIREIDPHAKIVIGEVCPLNENGSLEYLKAIIASDVLPLADGLAWHGSSGNSLDYQPDFYRSYPGWINEFMVSSKQNGFNGQFFATELHWRTAESAQPIDGMPWFYSNVVAGKYYARGITFNLSKGFWITAGHENYESIPEVVTAIRSLTKILAGAEPAEVEVQFDSSIDELRSAAFTMPDGRHLVAVWRDVKAVDDDPGVISTLTLPDMQANKVTGINPLYAYHQALNFTSANGVTVPGILVYDYPTFLMIE
jgi:hypothetical protein